jgi:hypothetical protein
MQITVFRTEIETGKQIRKYCLLHPSGKNIPVLSCLNSGGRTVLGPHVEPERIAIFKGGGAVLADCRLLADVLRSDVTAQAAPVDPSAAVVAFNVRP